MNSEVFLKVIFIAAVFTMIIFQGCSNSTDKISNQPTTVNDTHLGEMMGHMQYEFVKLGLAIQHGNQPLANFYMHEVNEAYDEIVAAKIIDNQINISEKITQIFPTKRRLETVIASNDTASFRSAYHGMVVSC